MIVHLEYHFQILPSLCFFGKIIKCSYWRLQFEYAYQILRGVRWSIQIHPIQLSLDVSIEPEYKFFLFTDSARDVITRNSLSYSSWFLVYCWQVTQKLWKCTRWVRTSTFIHKPLQQRSKPIEYIRNRGNELTKAALFLLLSESWAMKHII